MAVVDRDYRLVWLRDPLLDRLSPADRLWEGQTPIGQPCHVVMAASPTPCRHACPVAPLFATGRPQVVERHFIDPRGREQWREARAFPVVDGQGRVTHAVRISFDITRRKQDQAREERETAEVERSLEELNRIQLSRLPFQPRGGPGLTGRELEILRLAAQGLSKPRIARLLTISPNTVKRHMANIYNKLGVANRTQAAVWAARQGLI